MGWPVPGRLAASLQGAYAAVVLLSHDCSHAVLVPAALVIQLTKVLPLCWLRRLPANTMWFATCAVPSSHSEDTLRGQHQDCELQHHCWPQHDWQHSFNLFQELCRCAFDMMPVFR